MQYLLHHPVEYMQLCANARAYISRNYDWNVIMQKFSNVIEAVGGESPRMRER